MHSDERETGDNNNPHHVFETLSDDVDQCFERIQQDLYGTDDNGDFRFDQSNARTYARAAFACIEGFACFVRGWSISRLHDEDRLTNLECFPSVEPKFEEREVPPAKRAPTASLEESVRSMFSRMDGAHPIEPDRDAGKHWWTHFQAAIRIKDRLTYPRSAADLAVSHADLMTIIDADAGFRLLLSRYLEQSPPLELIEHVDG